MHWALQKPRRSDENTKITFDAINIEFIAAALKYILSLINLSFNRDF
jgi:hypothetical protein